jgi:phosphatidylserine decarboxylase
MRLPLTPHGTREILLYGLLPIALGAALFPVLPWVSPLLFAVGLFVFAFFRDPGRSPEGGPEAAVAPADGKVTDIGTVDEPHFLGGKALRIGIFLSVFNVHINRAPLDGKAVFLLYRKGAFLDVRDPACPERNESNLIGFEGPRGRFAVRQVAGLIARRIVCPLKEGTEVARGARMGMIKFGSRTELLFPADARVRVEARLGQKVSGGKTVLCRYES